MFYHLVAFITTSISCVILQLSCDRCFTQHAYTEGIHSGHQVVFIYIIARKTHSESFFSFSFFSEGFSEG